MENVTVLDNLVDTSFVMRLFRRGELTISYWRKNDGMPYVRIPGEGRDTIRFDKGKVLRWAKKTRRRIYPVTGSSPVGSSKAA